MRTALLTIVGAGVLLLVGQTPSFASEVNCGIVMKSVKMGRSVQDIAETMMISAADVEKCKAGAEAPKEGQPPNSEKPVVEKKPEGGGAMH